MLNSFIVEAEEDKHLDGQHAVEEAMSTSSHITLRRSFLIFVARHKAAALMRNCPKCKKAFIKEGGVRIPAVLTNAPRITNIHTIFANQCNKMTCPYCGTHSCYTCRKQITGYDHFDLVRRACSFYQVVQPLIRFLCPSLLSEALEPWRTCRGWQVPNS